MATQRGALSVEQIVDAAAVAIAEDGLAKLSMRRLGARLGVDPMAIYHHVDGKQTLLGLVLAQVLSELPAVDRTQPWAAQVREWALAYWELASRHRELVGAALADPLIAQGALRAIEPLTDALSESGLGPASIEAVAYLVVDFAHGSALSGAVAERPDDVRAWFEQGLDVVIAGVEATAGG